MPYWIILTLFFAHSKKHSVYIALVCFALTTAGASLSSVLVINQAALSSLDASSLTPSYVIKAQPEQPIALSLYAELRQAGVMDSVAVTSRYDTINGQRVRFIGADILALLNSRLNVSWQNASASGRTSSPLGAGLITASTASRLGMSSHARLTLSNNKQTPVLVPGAFPLTGLSDDAESSVLLPLGQFFSLFAPHNTLDAIFIIHPKQQLALERINALLPPGLRVQKVTSETNATDMGESFSFHIVAMAGLMVVVSLFIITNALFMLMAYRSTVINRLRKLGIAKKQITLCLIAELSGYCVLSSLTGVLIGLWAITQFDLGITSTLSTLLNTPFSFQRVSFLSIGLMSVLLCVIGMAFAAHIPLKHAMKTESVSAYRHLSLTRIAGFIAVTIFVAMGLLLLKHKIADLAVLALLLLAFAALMIVLMPAILGLLARMFAARYAVTHWSLKSAQTVSTKCKLAASAYFIALVSAIGLTGMVDSFRKATDSWLSQRLVADAYVYTSKPTEVPAAAGLSLVTRQTTVLTVNHRPVEVKSYPLTDTYKNAMVFALHTPDVWRKFANGTAILVNQQLAYRLGLHLGQTVEVSQSEQPQRFEVAGVYYDYGNPHDGALLAESLFSQGDSYDRVVALHKQNTESVNWAAYHSTLHTVLPDSSLLTRSALLELSMGVFDKTFVLTDGLTVVALVVSAMSFAITIGLLSRHLQQNIRILSALGVRFRHIQRAVLFQFSIICLLVTLLAIPAGILLSYFLITVVNVNAFGWTYPMEIDTTAIATIVISGFVGMLVVCQLALQRVSTHRLPSGFMAVCLLMTVYLSGCSPAVQNQSVFAGLANQQDEYSYQVVSGDSPVVLPADHLAHPGYQLEWWYVTSVLYDEANRAYPFQYTLFRFNQDGVQTYMAHASLHLQDEHVFEERFGDGALPTAELQATPFTLRLDNWIWRGADDGHPFPATLTLTFVNGPEMNVELESTGPYVLHGNNGISQKSADGQHVSYYYSQPFLRARATVNTGSKTLRLSGNAWYDHEWTSQLVNERVAGWDWFSLHLDSGDKLMAFRLRVSEHADYYTGTYITASGETIHLKPDQLTLTPGEEDVPLRWHISVPAQSISVDISPIKENQWNRATVTYYEGGVTVSGSHSGTGFMELTGYQSHHDP